MGSGNLQLKIINPLSYDGWDKLLMSAEGYSIFHSQAWARVLHDSYQYHPLYFTIIDRGRLSTLVPVMEVKSAVTGQRGVSLPFTDYCEPLVSDKIQFREILNLIIRYGKEAGWKYFELRGGNGLQINTASSSYYYTHTLDLGQGEEEVFAKYRDNTKRNIKKALKNNVQVAVHRSPESVQEYYLLHCLTRKRQGLPPQPFYFFKNIYEHIISKKLGFVVLATHQKRIVSGAVYFHFGKKVIYKFGASDMACQHLRANNLVMHHAIQWSIQNGYREFCFGRTEPFHEGLIRFKEGWGTQGHHLNYYKFDLRKDSFIQDGQKKNRDGYFIFREMPVPLLKMAGNLLYRHIG